MAPERSKADEIPAYVVFHNSTLAEIASRRPTTIAELASVPGVGPAKLERYGAEVLDASRALWPRRQPEARAAGLVALCAGGLLALAGCSDGKAKTVAESVRGRRQHVRLWLAVRR